MLKNLLDNARATLAEVSEERIVALEAACHDAEQARAAAAEKPASEETERLRIGAQRSADILARERSRRNDALMTLKRYARFENPAPPAGAPEALRRLESAIAERKKIEIALADAKKDETAAIDTLEKARQAVRAAAGSAKLGEVGIAIAGERKRLAEASSAVEIAGFAVEEIASRLADADKALAAAESEAAEAREAVIEYQFRLACRSYLDVSEQLLPVAARIRAAAQLLQYPTPDGVTDGRALGLDFGMGEMVAAVRAELLIATAVAPQTDSISDHERKAA